jgi:6-phosphogluconate dehydrogenase
MVGLGKMGLKMLQRLRQGGHDVVAYDIDEKVVSAAAREGSTTVESLAGFSVALQGRRVVWLMVPAGAVTEQAIQSLAAVMGPGDIIIDGGNSNYKDTVQRAMTLAALGIHLLDVGTSGGVWGLDNGYCLMVGGEGGAFRYAEPLFKTLAPENGYERVGPSGSGHFAKMVHNGIEYAMMQSYAEGFEILQAKKEFGFDLQKIAALWNQGSVVRSWLLELLNHALVKDSNLSKIKGYVEDSGEGRWTVMAAIEEGVSAPTIALSLFERFRSRKEDTFGNRVLAALRAEFGGHAIEKK